MLVLNVFLFLFSMQVSNLWLIQLVLCLDTASLKLIHLEK